MDLRKGEQVGASEMNLLACPRCGHAQPEAQFCEKCGSPLLTPDEQLCPGRKTVDAPDARFCTACGSQISQAPPATGPPATGVLICPNCGASRFKGYYCEQCGTHLLAKKAGVSTREQERWNLPGWTGAFWGGALRDTTIRIAMAVLFAILIFGIISNLGSGISGIGSIVRGLPYLIMWGVVIVPVTAWYERRRGVPGAVWRGPSIGAVIIGAIALLLGPGVFYDKPSFITLLYFAFPLFALALMLFGVSWVGVQNARKTERDKKLRLVMKRMAPSQTAQPSSVAGAASPISIADELTKLGYPCRGVGC